eukprot:7220337-Heterocapsa_arctica.AAC.1
MGDQTQRWQIHLSGDTGGKLRPEENWQKSEENISRQRTLIAISVMKESITARLPVRRSRLDAT